MNNALPPSESDLTANTRSDKPRRRWLRVLAWTAAGLVSLVLLLCIALTIAINSKRFHEYVLATAQKQASDALGVRVQLQNFTPHLSDLSLDLYGITVDGAAPYANPPLLQVDHVQVGVRIVSLLQRKWYLDNFRIDRPIARVIVDVHGVSNIPTIKSSGDSNSNTNLFDLAIRHAVLDQGEVYYNDKQSVLAADVHDVEFQSSFNTTLQQYAGSLAYTDGHLVSGTYRPIPHNLDAHFDATRTTLHLTSTKVSSGPSQITINASLDNYSSPTVAASYDAVLDGDQFRKILNVPSIPKGLVRAVGSVHYHQAPHQTLLQALALDGDLSSRRLDVNTPQLHTQIGNLAAHYSLINGDATVQNLQANLLGGAITADAKMTAIGGDSHSTVDLVLHNLSLAELRRTLAPSAGATNVHLSGKLNATANAAWGKTLDDLVAKADASINGNIAGNIAKNVAEAQGTSGNTSANTGISTTSTTIPIESALHGTYRAASKQATLTQSYLRTPQTSLTMNGAVNASTKNASSALDLHLQANDLHEIETIADLFRTPTPGQPLQPLGLAGTASFQGRVQGTTSAPHLTGQLTALNLHAHRSEWKLLRTDVDLSPSYAALQHADLQPASHGRITFNASTALTKWAFTDSSSLHVDLDASQLDIAEFAKLANQQIPVTGNLNASLRLHGTELNPIGDGNVSLSNLVAYDQPFQSVKLTFSGTGDQANGDLNVQLPAGTVQSKFSVRPHDKSYTAQLTASNIRLDKLQALTARNIDATGTLALHATGQGTFDNPQLDATLDIPQLTVQNQTITALNLKMNVANHVANANLTTSAINTSIRANAKVNLAGDYLADASLDTTAIPIEPLLAVYAPEQAADVTGQTEVHATLHGPLKDKNHLEAHLTIPVLKLAYSNTVQLAAASPIHVNYKNGVVDLERAAIRGTDTDLQFQGSIPVSGNGPMSLLMLGTVNLKLAQLFQPDIRSAGELKFNINSNGPTSSQDIGGQVDIVDASYASSDLPVGLQHGNGVLKLTKGRLNIQSFQGTVGGGTVTAQGGIDYQPKVQFNLGLAAQGIRVLYPQGVRESIDANLRFSGTTDNALLGGSVNLSDLSFTSAFDLSDFIGQFSGGVAAPPTRGLAQNIELNLAVRSTNDVALVSRALTINGSANLQVRGTAANPVILGRINLNNGDIILNGDRFVLNGGTVQFVNPTETQPVVNLSLTTNIQQYSVSLRFNGPISQMRTEYSSDPALPAADIINLLAFGKTTEAGVGDPTTSTNQAAESLVASQVSSQVTSRLSKVAGISQLSINPVLASGSSQGPPGANITIQQRVTGNLFVTFSSNVASTQSQVIQGQYQISPRVAVSATRDQNGGFAVDALIKKSW